MKTRTFCLAVVTGLLAMLPLRTAQAGTAFSYGISISSANDFYEPLAPYGHWVEMSPYGRCWYPAYVSNEWQPYATGHWEWTDQGWYWVSDEPWAWATYHYGRWVWDPYYGWLWVPGTEWAPAWIAWREGGGYYGWAPLPPVGYCDAGGLVMWEQVSWYSRAFVFVEFGGFCGPIHYRYHYHRGGHHPFFDRTANIIGDPRHGGHGGPRVGAVEQHVGRPLPPMRTADLWRAHSDLAGQRASLDHVTAPPTVSKPSSGAVERPHQWSNRTHATQPSQQREPERRVVTSQPQSQREPERRGIALEPRRAAASPPTVTGSAVERQGQRSSWQQRTESRREVAQPQWRSQPAPEQRVVRAAPASPRETRTFQAPAQREERSSDSGRSSSDRSERSGSFGSSDSRGGGGSWGPPSGGNRMGDRGGRR